jgi:hypothetical protein
VDLANSPCSYAGSFVGETPEQVRGRGDPVSLLRHQRHPVLDPGIFNELGGLPFERAEHCTY